MCRLMNETKVEHTTLQIVEPLLYAWHIVCNLIALLGSPRYSLPRIAASLNVIANNDTAVSTEIAWGNAARHPQAQN